MNEQEFLLLKGIFRKESWKLLGAIVLMALMVFFIPGHQRRVIQGGDGRLIDMNAYWIGVVVGGIIGLILLMVMLKDYLKLLRDVLSKRKYTYEKQISLISKADDETWALGLTPSGELIEMGEIKIKTAEFEVLQPAVGDTLRINTGFYTRRVLSLEIAG
ncbi:hypothetical protein [Chitinophaga niabensis]|uniref:Uncharacterized protein n=1 Tax=Chitinophaga niabensis TaxID=536979 RepID=A0A1N6JST0_9BACT|nr:hypothetical protein [Chitinophaga niabensis]SIO47382.1 hypothetical protein SAMN04488055_4360 [Chitinophaga niabensis]